MLASFTSQTAAYLRLKNLWNLSLLFFSQSLHCRSLTLLCCTLCFLFVYFFCFTELFLYEIIELFETGFKLSHRAPAFLGSFWWLFINVLHFPEFVERDKFLLLMIHSQPYFFIGLRSMYTIYTVTTCEPWHSNFLGSELCQFFVAMWWSLFVEQKGYLLIELMWINSSRTLQIWYETMTLCML